MLTKKELIEIIVENQKEKLDKEIEDNTNYKYEMDYLKELIDSNKTEVKLEEQIINIINLVQDLAYKKGVEEGLNLKELL